MARILVVDDDEMDRLLERSILEDVGHELYFAKDGAGALKVFRDKDIEVVITDLNMPDVDGLRLIHEIREIDPDAELIVVSGLEQGRLDMAHELAEVQTLAKPVDPQGLIDAVAKAVERARLGPPG